MIRKIKTKSDLSHELEQEIMEYLTTGGEIQHIDKGISGKEIGANINQSLSHFGTQGAQTRTPLTEEIKALDARKSHKPKIVEKNRPIKKIIYDDFGEPIREIWE